MPAKTTKTTAKKATTQKPAAKKTATKSAAATKKAPAKKAPTKKAPAKKSARKDLNESLQLEASSITPYKGKKGEEYMNTEQRQHLEKILISWRHALLENSEGTKSHLQSEAANYPDPNDRASQEEEFSIELRTRDRERKLLKKIEETLDRIHDDEDFGYCEACGIEIGIPRLEARPTANLCIDCKTLAEIKERQTEGG